MPTASAAQQTHQMLLERAGGADEGGGGAERGCTEESPRDSAYEELVVQPDDRSEAGLGNSG